MDHCGHVSFMIFDQAAKDNNINFDSASLNWVI